MEPYDVIVNQPVVIDNGSGVIKAGFAGDQVTQTSIGKYYTCSPSRFPSVTSPTTLGDQNTAG